jgi:flagellar assembly protein FliH
MALIRQADRQERSKDAIALHLGDLLQLGETLRADATATAQKLVSDAKTERERLVANAARDGHAQGLAKGTDEGRRKGEADGRVAAIEEFRKRSAELEAGLVRGLATLEAQRGRLLADATDDVVRLALDIASRVVKRVIDADSGVVRDQVAAALALITAPTRCIITLAPADEAIVREALPKLAETIDGARHAELRTDAALARGSCIVHGAGGSVDASIGVQLDRIAEAIVPGGGARPAAPDVTREPDARATPDAPAAPGEPADPSAGGEA